MVGLGAVSRCRFGQQRWRSARLRQFDPEQAALTHLALEAHVPAHGAHQAFGDDQPDPGSLHAAALRAQAVKGREHGGCAVLRNAHAGVLHANAHAGFAPARGRGRSALAGHTDRALRPVVLDGVGEQVDHHLAQPHGIGHNDGVARVATRIDDADALLGSQRCDQGQAFVDHRLQRNTGHGQLQAAALHLSQVDQVVHQREQMLPGTLNLARVVARRRCQLRISAQQLGKAQNRVQRRLQLVTDAGQECALGAVRPLGFVARQHQRLFGADAIRDVDAKGVIHGVRAAVFAAHHMGHLQVDPRARRRRRIGTGRDSAAGMSRQFDLSGDLGEMFVADHVAHGPPDNIRRIQSNQDCQPVVHVAVDKNCVDHAHVSGKSVHYGALLARAGAQGLESAFLQGNVAERPDPGNP